MLRKAPPALMPVPSNVNASAPMVMPVLALYSSRAAPSVTVVPPAAVPSAVLFAALNTPALIVVAPV